MVSLKLVLEVFDDIAEFITSVAVARHEPPHLHSRCKVLSQDVHLVEEKDDARLGQQFIRADLPPEGDRILL
jgi:hypothetical protein